MATKKKTTAKRTKKKRSTKANTSKRDELGTFAIRLSIEERAAFHRAAGPRRATQFVRSIAVAAARNDVKGIQRVLKEAREAQS